jgi:hypothetical protein
MSPGQPQSFSSQLDVLKICVYLPNYRQNLMVSLGEYPRGYTDAAAAPTRTPDPRPRSAPPTRVPLATTSNPVLSFTYGR